MDIYQDYKDAASISKRLTVKATDEEIHIMAVKGVADKNHVSVDFVEKFLKMVEVQKDMG